MTARPSDVARLIAGTVDPTSDPSHPRILTDHGIVRLGLRGWHLYRTGRVEPPLGSWDASALEIAAAFVRVTDKAVA